MSSQNQESTLTEDEVRKVVRDELRSTDEEASGGRREFLQALGLGGLAAGVGGGAGYAARSAVEPAAADASTSDSDGDIGTPSDRVDVYADGINANVQDVDEVLGNYPGKVRAIANGRVVASVNPANSTTPVQDAIDAAASELSGQNSGYVYIPPRDESNPIQNANAIVPESQVNLFCPGYTTVEITGSGEDLIRIDNSLSTGSGRTSFDIIGHLVIQHANGPTGTTGHGINDVTGMVDCDWDFVKVRQVNGSAWYADGSTGSFNNDFGTFETAEIDASGVTYNAGAGTGGIVTHATYGPGNTWDRVSVNPYNSANDMRGVVMDNSGGNIRYLQADGPINITAYLRAPNHGIRIDIINDECNPATSPNAVVDTAGGTPTKIGHYRYGPNRAASFVYSLSGAATEHYLGDVQAQGTIGTNVVETTHTTTNVYFEGESTEVTDNSGGTLSPGVACLADLTLVT